MSEQVVTRTVHERMVDILAELPPIGKDQRNEQQGFMFRGHDDVLNALNPLLAKHGVLVIPDVLERVTEQRTTAKGSVMFEVNLHVRYRFYGAAGDSIEASTWGEGTDMGDKATNKAMTMAFKNVLNQAFAISNKEMADADADTPEETVSRKASSPATTRTPNEDRAQPGGPTPQNTDEFRFASGKHQGKTMAEVPRGYVEWCVADHPKPEVRELAAVFLGFEAAGVGAAANPDDEIPF